MTQPLALWLGGLLVLGAALDAALHGGASSLFLARALLDIVHWLAFWR